MTHLLTRSGRLLATASLLGALSTSACDTTAKIYVSSPKFDGLQIVSAYPAKKQSDGSWERVCGVGQADGLVTNVVFRSTGRGNNSSVDADRDLSIRPLDVIQTRVVDGGSPDDINLSNVGNLNMNLGCINVASNTTGTCEGALATATLDQIRYNANTPDRSVGHNVMVLVDQSGSISGLVRDGSYKEQRIVDQIPSRPGDFASDPRSLRLSVAKRLLSTLNSTDKVGVLAFGEQMNLSVPCAGAVNDVQTDLGTCFGARNRDIWVEIDRLQGNTGGRSNLWLAVKTAYDFLRAKNDRVASNHIIVLTDGPDTCAGENRLTCEAACTTADFGQLADQVESDMNDPNAPKIHVHFVQFESLGYAGRDPRQVELSCVSRGHYQFINSNQFPRIQTQSFQDALDTAVTNVRYSLMGHWELGASVPAYQTNAGGGAGIPPGNVYALEGQLLVKTSSNLVSTDRTYPFGIGLGEGASTATTWDRRPTVRKPCGGFSDCGAATAGGACEVLCSSETLTCASGSSPVQLPDLALCEPSVGTSGFCCGGSCQSAGDCAACNE